MLCLNTHRVPVSNFFTHRVDTSGMKNIRRIFAIVICCAAIGTQAHAALTPEQRTRDAQQMIDLFTHRYGPMSWKREYLHLDFAAMSRTLLQRAAAVTNDLDFYEALIAFVSGFQDAHVSITLPSTYRALLGFDIAAFGTDYLITDINRDLLPETTFPFHAGDTVTHFDGRPIDTMARAIAQYDASGSRAFDRRAGAALLTTRSQSKIPHLPTGFANITIRARESGIARTVAIAWTFRGTPLADFTESTIGKALAAVITPPLPPVEVYQKAPLFAQWPQFVERNTAPFLSGVIVLGELRIGFIRPHTWSNLDNSQVIAQFEKDIAYFNTHTDALILDQTNNPGGNICLGERIAEFFIDEPIVGTRFRIKPTRTWIKSFEAELDDLPEDARRLQKALVAQIRQAAENGAELTDPIPLCSASGMLEPHVVKNADGTPLQDDARHPRTLTYQHPVLLLIDTAACSTGDMFPALLQDAGAATLFGERTVGCGGNVTSVDYLGFSDITVRITLSLAVRSKTIVSDRGVATQYLENVGVMPDIPYAVTGADYLDGGTKYRAAVEAAVRRLVQHNLQ